MTWSPTSRASKFSASASSPCEPAFSNGFTHRIPLTVRGGSLTGTTTLAGFPLLIDVSDPASPGLVALVRGIHGISMPYTLVVNHDHLYVFGTEEAAMAVFRLERGEPALAFARWNFGTGDDEALVEGRAADRGQGLLRYLDAAGDDERTTRGQTTAGVDRGIGYLEFRPAGDWKPHNGLVLDHGLDDELTHGGDLSGERRLEAVARSREDPTRPGITQGALPRRGASSQQPFSTRRFRI